jgi:phage terminase large subunit
MTYVPGVAPPTLEDLQNDPSIVSRLSHQELEILVKLVAGLPTPAAKISNTKFYDPFKFFTDVLGWKPSKEALKYGYHEAITPDQRKVVESVLKNQKTAVTAGHGTGKTHIAAAVGLWYYQAFGPNAIVLTTASSAKQVENVLWPKIRTFFYEADGKIQGTVLNTAIKSGYPNWFMLGFATRGDTADMSATRFHGFHAPHVLVIIDEATAVDEDIWQGAEGITLGPQNRILALGNPTDPTSSFRKRCLSPSWNWVRMDCRKHPNVEHDNPYIIPGGAVTRQWVEERALEFGGENSPGFKAKVTGEWPDSSIDALIPLHWVDSANARWSDWTLNGHDSDGKGAFIGLDVAREGSDMTTFSICRDGVLQPLLVYSGRDTSVTTEAAIRLIKDHGARMIAVDDNGVGGGVTDNLRKAQRDGDLPDKNSFRIVPVNFSENADDESRFHRIKDELWWLLRESMQVDRVAIPSESEIRKLVTLPPHISSTEQITKAIYVMDSRSRVDVLDRREPGDDRTLHMPKRSPDVAHSYILAHYVWLRAKMLQEPKMAGQEDGYTKTRLKTWLEKTIKESKRKWEGTHVVTPRGPREREKLPI